MSSPASTLLQLPTNDGMPSEAVFARVGSDSKLQHWLCSSGLAVMDAATAFYTTPHGLVRFEHHKYAYCTTLDGAVAISIHPSEAAGHAAAMASTLRPCTNGDDGAVFMDKSPSEAAGHAAAVTSTSTMQPRTNGDDGGAVSIDISPSEAAGHAAATASTLRPHTNGDDGAVLIDISPSEAAADHVAAKSSTLTNDGDDNAFSIIGISPSEAMVAAVGSDSKQLPRWLFASGFAELVMVAGITFYRSPHGVIFEKHRSAYYGTLAGIFAAGLAKVGTACWLASSGQQGQGRGRAFRASVVCASVVPLVAIIGLGGFSVVMKD